MIGAPEHCDSGHCVTCSDEGLPMRVLAPGADGLASCLDGEGARYEVMTELLGALVAGDVVLVHAGVALARVDGGELA